MIDIEFGKRFTELMDNADISNSELRELLGISKNNIGNYKNGQIPNATNLYKLSQFFGKSMEYILTGKEATDLSAEEQQLVELFRHADERGKRTILRTAKSESMELESSASRNGLTATGES